MRPPRVLVVRFEWGNACVRCVLLCILCLRGVASLTVFAPQISQSAFFCCIYPPILFKRNAPCVLTLSEDIYSSARDTVQYRNLVVLEAGRRFACTACVCQLSDYSLTERLFGKCRTATRTPRTVSDTDNTSHALYLTSPPRCCQQYTARLGRGLTFLPPPSRFFARIEQ